MSKALDKLNHDLQKKLDFISENTPILNGGDHKVELNPKNPRHREWYEIDKYRDE